MRLLTHNILQCNAKKCRNPTDGKRLNYPLKFSNVELSEDVPEMEFNPNFVQGFLKKLDYNVLYQTCLELGITDLPKEIKEEQVEEEVLQLLHRVLFEVQIESGNMTCQSCGHNYPIQNGIANMLLNEDEV